MQMLFPHVQKPEIKLFIMDLNSSSSNQIPLDLKLHVSFPPMVAPKSPEKQLLKVRETSRATGAAAGEKIAFPPHATNKTLA